MARQFDELVGTNFFDESFKNMIRDYYAYGFKTYQDFPKSRGTIDQNWKNLSRILGGRWEFRKGKGGANQVFLRTFESGMANPVNEVYRCHNLNAIGDFLTYLLELDDRSSLREGLASLPIGRREREEIEAMQDTDEVKYALLDGWLRGQKERTPKIRINYQLYFLAPSMASREKDKYKNLRNRLLPLNEMGVICNLSTPRNVGLRNRWKQELWRTYDPAGKGRREFSRNTENTPDYWMKSPLTMEWLVQEGEKREEGFAEKFGGLLQFFSRCLVFGELGSFLCSRMEAGQRMPRGGPEVFRFKHHYLMETLYDYNLSDLLAAAEEGYFCHVSYRHGVRGTEAECLILPLQIRVSVLNGREYVLYYDPEQHRVGSLRVDFIDRLELYRSLGQVDRITQKKRVRLVFDRDRIRSEIKEAKEMLPYIWGVEIGPCRIDGNWRERLAKATVCVSYREGLEAYISGRLLRERRRGSVTGTGQIELLAFPTKELRSWVRSFYCRVRSVSGMADGFEVEEDVERMYRLYYEGLLPVWETGKEKEGSRAEGCPEGDGTRYEIRGERVSEYEGHASLFHELFSRHAEILAESVLACAREGGADFREELLCRVTDRFTYYSPGEAEEAARKLAGFAYGSGLVDPSGHSRFCTERGSYLYELLPLTRLECRWLVTALGQPLAGIFLGRETLRQLAGLIKERALFEVRAFDLSRIFYFDRFHARGRKADEENLRVLYDALKSGRELAFSYRTRKGEPRSVPRCMPVWLEYSKRDGLMKLWAQEPGNEWRTIYNVERIEGKAVVLEGSRCDVEALQRRVEAGIRDRMQSLAVLFYDNGRNLPDRLLTEFALWKKECRYDRESGQYRMTLYYPQDDEREILIRLLGYGPHIKLDAGGSNGVLRELKRRVAIQRELCRRAERER